jgi:hypothetical protein
MKPTFIEPDWPAPPNIRAYSTLRTGGYSLGVYDSFNLGIHVGDDPQQVAANRRLLREALNLPTEPYWLNQVHGKDVVAAHQTNSTPPTADAAYSTEPGTVCVVMTADCLPVLFCNRQGTHIAAAHAGWRGLADGVLETTVQALGAGDWLAWLGPSIGPQAFEVGPPVRQAFLDTLDNCADAFQQTDETHWLADLYHLARISLARVGISEVYGGDYCTYSDATRFYSYRRDGQTGRMATLIWRE